MCQTHLRRHGLVDWAPPDVVLGAILLYDTLVRGRAASLSARVSRKGARGCDGGTGLVDEGIFVESRDGRVGDLNLLLACVGGASTDVLLEIARWLSYNSDAVVVNVCLLVKLLLDLSVLGLGPGGGMLVVDLMLDDYDATYWTPLGWRAVLFTLWETIVATLCREVEWKLLLCCFAIWSVRKVLEESGSGGGGV
jgi:hypothetical protein